MLHQAFEVLFEQAIIATLLSYLSYLSDNIYPFPLSFTSLFQETKLTCNTSGSNSALHPRKGQIPHSLGKVVRFKCPRLAGGWLKF